jgi:hypothetical protein
VVFGKALRILGQAELFEPIRNLLHGGAPGFNAIRSGPGEQKVYHTPQHITAPTQGAHVRRGSKAEKLKASKCFLLLPQQRTFIRRRDYDVTNQPPILSFHLAGRKERDLHLRPSTRRVAADRHLASNAPRCSDRRYSQIWLGRTGLVFSASMTGCWCWRWRCRFRSCA